MQTTNETSSLSAGDVMGRPKQAVISGVLCNLCPCCGLPKKPKGSALKRLDILTIKLMQEAGFRFIGERRAWLWETRRQMQERGVEPPPIEKVSAKMKAAFAGREDEIPHGRISFFHTIRMQKGHLPPAQYENVLFFERLPLDAAPRT